MKSFIAIGIGGLFGASMRYLLGLILPSTSGFPYATLGANLLGCFLLAWIFTKYTNRTPIVLAIGTGFFGAFTTFSAFTLETILLIQSGLWLYVTLYIGASIFGGIFFAFFGAFLANRRCT